MNREICGQCGQSLDPNWIDERIPKLESMLCEAIRERDSLRAHLHDEHQRHVGTMDERDTALDDLAAARADAERYRWLRGDVQDDFSTRWSRWRIEHWASPGPTWSDIRGADLDAAIDAAIAGEKK